MDHNQQSGGGQRRGHFHRGRRGPDRRGPERRQRPPGAEGQKPQPRSGEQVDVEQIMRDIRARISQLHGVDLSPAQIQELAANRLDAILEPRNVNPTLLDQLRKAAGTPTGVSPVKPPQPASLAAEQSLFDSFFRRLFKPLLKLFFNPDPLVTALSEQARQIAEAATREAERDRQQAEWNALHYELMQRMVRESARNTIEVQDLALRIESLAAKVDFNERRVRSLEGTGAHQQPFRQQQRPPDTPVAIAQPAADSGAAPGDGSAAVPGEGQRRRRRRRRGRRGGGGAEPVMTSSDAAVQDDLVSDVDEGPEDSSAGDRDDSSELSTGAQAIAAATPEPLTTEPLSPAALPPEGLAPGPPQHDPLQPEPPRPDPALTPLSDETTDPASPEDPRDR